MTETARIYGGSLYDLAVEENRTEEMMEQLLTIRGLFRENPGYQRLLSEPSIPKEERVGLIETAFGESADRYLVNFLKILCERNILLEFSGACEEYVRRYRVDRGIAEAMVTSAIPLSGEQEAALLAKLESMSGKKILLRKKVDPSVLAGIRVELDGKLLDGTVKSRLAGISRGLKETVL